VLNISTALKAKKEHMTTISALIRDVTQEWLVNKSDEISEAQYINDGYCLLFAEEVLQRAKGIDALRLMNLAGVQVRGDGDDGGESGRPFDRELLAAGCPL